MSCQDFQALILDSSEVGHHPALEVHLAGCQECREFQQLWNGLGDLATPEPPKGMSQRFHQRLALEMMAQPGRSHPVLTSWWLPLSTAAALLLTAGMAMGYMIRGGRATRNPGIAGVQGGFPQDPIEVLALVSAGGAPKGDVVSALIKTLSHDTRIDVRLTAVEALYFFGSDPQLSQHIEVALRTQDQPEVQLALIDLMANLRQKQAADALRRLIRGGKLRPETRVHAELRLQQMTL